MNIAIDAQPVIDNQKTGVGFYEYNIAWQLIKHWPQNNYTLNCFKIRRRLEVENALRAFTEMGGKLNICHWFPGSLYRFIWNFVPMSYSLFFGKIADVTHFFNYHTPPGVAGKKVVIIYDMVYRAFPETVKLRTKIMLNISLKASISRTDRIITISEFSKSEIIKYMRVSPDCITVAPCGVDTSIFFPVNAECIRTTKQKYNIPDRYLLYAGTLEPRKNIERLIEAYAMVLNENPEVPALILAGRKGWLYNGIFEKVRSLNIARRVVFTGYIDDADMPALLSGAIIFLFPSLYEGFGLPPLEAMACGVPVLTSTAASLPEVVGEAAVMVDPYNTEEIKDGIIRLIHDVNLRKSLSAKGLEHAKQFSWTRSAEIIMEVYKNLTGEAG